MSEAPKPEFPPLFGPGFYPMTLVELRERCVAAFPLSQTRAPIMAGLEEVVSTLVGVGISGELWVDGSFLTEKIDPEDADMVLDLTSVDAEAVTPQQLDALNWYMDRERHTSHHCDNYVFFEEERRAYWTKQFGFSRGKDAKGIVVLRLMGGAT